MYKITSQSISILSNRKSKAGRFSASKSRLLLTTALIGGISAGITAAFAADPIDIISATPVTHNNTDDIGTALLSTPGIHILTDQTIDLTNSGNVISLLDSGINTASVGSTTITNSGVIIAQVSAIVSRSNENITVKNTADVASNIGTAITILAGLDAKLESSGLIESGNGIAVFSAADENVAGGSVNVTNSGEIRLNDGATYSNIETAHFSENSGANGILAVASNKMIYTVGDNNGHQTIYSSDTRDPDPDGLNVTVTNTGKIADFGDGVDVATSNSTGIGAGALGNVTIDNEGAISVGRNGIVALAGGNIVAENEGDITLTNGSVGISLDTRKILPDADGGNISLANSGTIIATGAYEGIDIDSRGTATVTNSGDISASTFVGIEVEAAGAVNLTNSGKIETSGNNADGIATSSDTSDSVINSGEIIASDAGIRAGGFGFTTVTNQEDGNIHGGNVGISSAGGDASTIVNAGKIEADEYGIKSTAYGGTSSFPEDDDDDESIFTERSFPGGKVDITNSGTITMAQPDSQQNERWEMDGHSLKSSGNVAVLAVSMNGGSKFENQYDELGNLSEDEFKVTPAADNVANNAVSVTNSGTIDGSNSDQSHGIFAMASDGVDIDNKGDITVANEAIYVIGHSPVSIKNSGNIKAGAFDGTSAVNVESQQRSENTNGDSVLVENSGKIETIGDYVDGIYIGADNVGTVINSGEIIASDAGVRSYGLGEVVIENKETGKIHGGNYGVNIGSGDDVKITNAGMIEVDEVGIRANVFGGTGSYSDELGNQHEYTISGGSIDISSSGTIKLVEANTSDNSEFELEGHTLSVPSKVAIFAVAANGGAEISKYYDQFGQLTEEREEFTAIADDNANNAIIINHSGTIDGTDTNYSHGIYAMASDGVEIINSGDIEVGATAIYAIGNSPVTIENSGTIKVNGEFGRHGVQAISGHYGDGTMGDAISVTNSGSIDLTGAGDYRRAINAWSNGGTSTVTNSGSVITTADGARGIHASSGGESLCDFDENNNCTLTPAVDGGLVTINSSGSVSTEGDNARAISSWSHGGAINITTSGTLTTEGDYARGIQAHTGETGGGTNKIVAKKGGAITVDNTATIDTEGTQSYGINGFSNGGSVDITNAGEITTAGEKANGITIQSGNSWLGNGGETQSGGAVSLTNKAGGDITTTAVEARAIQIGSASGNVTVVNGADLSTTGNKSYGIDAYSGSNVDNDNRAIFEGGKVSITNTGDIATQGTTATGLSGWSNGETVAIDNSGTISTIGEQSAGLGAYSGTGLTIDDRVIQAGSDITVSNAGTITTKGADAYGIDTYSYGGDIKIDLTADSSVSTTGKNARALSAASGSSSTVNERVRAAGGDIVANIDGTLSTTGEAANAVEIWTNGGDVSVKTAAGSKISTDGISSFGMQVHSGETRSTDKYEPHDGGAVSIVSAATVSTKGDYATAISAISANDTVTVSNTGNLTTTGDLVEGIAAQSGVEEDTTDGHVATDGKKVTVTNSGDITMTGEQTSAIVATSLNNAVSITNSGALKAGTSATTQAENTGILVWKSSTATIENLGAIDVKGDAAAGLFANSTTNTKITNSGDINVDGALALAGASAGNVTIENSGDLTLNRGLDAVNAWNGALIALSNGDVMIINKGDVTTTGSGMRAIHSSRAPESTGGDDTHPDSVTIENSGKLSTDGANAHGIHVESSGAVTIKNTGDSIVTGDKANGLVALAETTTNINNSGIINSATGNAIVTGKSADTIVNSGSLIGGASFGDNADTLTNTGTLEHKYYFGAGDDVLNLNAGSVYKDAIFDGEGDTDNVNFSGGGDLARGEFKNFETATIVEGNWTLSDTVNAFQTFNVANKGTLVLNDGILGAAQINLLAGSTLKGSGKVTGGLTNNGSILLASTDTLKIEGDFHSASGSKLEFALGGGDGSTHSFLEVTDGKFTFDSSDVFNIAVDANTDLAEDSRYKVATADGGVDDLATSSDVDAVKINDSSAAFAFDRTIEDNAVWISARATISDAVAELAPELAEEAGAVEQFVVDSGVGGALAEQLNGLNETQLVAAVAELTAPNEAAGHQSLNSTVSTANNIVDNRIAGRISGSSQRNFYTGNPADDPNTQNSYRAGAGQTEASEVVMAYGGEGIVGSRWLDEGGYSQAWVQAFWGNSTIDNSESNQYGTSVGLDFRPDQNTLIGGSFSYSRTNADATNSSLEADTYGGMLYGAKGFDSGLAFSGVIGYFLSQNDSKRQALGSIYSGGFDSNTFTLSGNVSQEIDLQQDWLFTPNAGVRYSHATFDDYTETGGVAPLTISRSDVDSVELSAEASFIRNFNFTDTTKGLFEFHVGGLYEAGDNDSTVAYRFSPTGTMLYSNSEVSRLKFNVGTLVEIPFSDQISSEFAYEGTFANNYADHLIRAKFKVKF